MSMQDSSQKPEGDAEMLDTRDMTVEERLDLVESKVEAIADALRFVMVSVGKTTPSLIVGAPPTTTTLAQGYAQYVQVRDTPEGNS